MKKPEPDKIDLNLEDGVTYVLLRDNKNYKRGLLIASNKDGSYEIAYWIDEKEPYPIEVLIDGKSVSKDAEIIKLNFHPKIDTQKSAAEGGVLFLRPFGRIRSIVSKSIEYRGEKFDGYNKPKRTPSHPKKSHAVLAKEGSVIKLIRFGQQGVSGAGKKPKTDAERARRRSFKARHAKNIKRGRLSAAYWADKVKW